RHRRVEVEDLLDQPHRRLVRRREDHERRIGEHRRGHQQQEGIESVHFGFGLRADSPSFSIQHFYSVITGSNVHNASVTNTTSKKTSIESQARAMGSSTSAWSSAAVPRTPAIITGIVIGYSRTGSSTSRLRARTSIAANNVPTAANPTVPVSSSPIISTGCAKSGARNIRPTRGTTNSSTAPPRINT